MVHNEVSYLDNEFPIEVYLRARQLSGENFTLSVTDPKGRQVFKKNLTIDEDVWFQRVDLFLKAKSAGLQRYQVEVVTEADEANKDNNQRSFPIEVVSNRKKVALIGREPTLILAAISDALLAVEKYEIDKALPGALQLTKW
ncbi:MAG: hypothetical protein U5L96_21700 [Owenweeksia sp.]|nr:hypothetical protein [Owenweeksia sp.]